MPSAEELLQATAVVEAFREAHRGPIPHLEVVLLGAECAEAIRATHPTYFRDFKAEPYSVEEAHRQLTQTIPERVAG